MSPSVSALEVSGNTVFTPPELGAFIARNVSDALGVPFTSQKLQYLFKQLCPARRQLLLLCATMWFIGCRYYLSGTDAFRLKLQLPLTSTAMAESRGSSGAAAP